jgi:competence protein ComGF
MEVSKMLKIFRSKPKKQLVMVQLGRSIQFIFKRPDPDGRYRVNGQEYEPLLKRQT